MGTDQFLLMKLHLTLSSVIFPLSCYPGEMTQLISPWCRIYASVNRVGIGSDNDLSPILHQAISWPHTGLLPIGPSGTNFSGILIKIQNFSFMKMHLKISSANWRPFCLSLNITYFERLWLVSPQRSLGKMIVTLKTSMCISNTF